MPFAKSGNGTGNLFKKHINELIILVASYAKQKGIFEEQLSQETYSKTNFRIHPEKKIKIHVYCF